MGKAAMLSAALLMIMLLPVNAAENGRFSEADGFMQIVRMQAAAQESFGDLRGRISHMRRNQGGAQHYPVRFTILFQREKVEAKLTLQGGENHYFIRDMLQKKRVIKSNPPDNPLLGKLGFKIEDLAMDFLEYPVKRELAAETVKTVDCRVLELQSADGGTVRVWIARKYFFPLKAEFYLPGARQNAKPERTLEITGFKQFGKYYAATDIALFSENYRTRIAFTDCIVVKSDDPRAAAEFKNLPKTEK